MSRMAALEGAIRVRTKRSNGRALENDGISLSQLDLSSGFARGLQDGSSIFPNLQIISNGD